MSGRRYAKVGARLGFSVVLVALATGFIFGQEMPAGLAQKYPGDAGIDKDPAVVFVENFETGELKDICARWGDARPGNLTLSDDVSSASPGKRSLRIAHHGQTTERHSARGIRIDPDLARIVGEALKKTRHTSPTGY